MKIKVRVTAKDIASGIKMSPGNCAVAKAIKRAVKHDEISCGINGVNIKSDARQIAFPQEVKRFVMRFDQGLRCKPFAFTLET